MGHQPIVLVVITSTTICDAVSNNHPRSSALRHINFDSTYEVPTSPHQHTFQALALGTSHQCATFAELESVILVAET